MGEKPDQLPPRNLGQIRRVSPTDFQQAVDAGRARIGEPSSNPDSLIYPTSSEIFAAKLFGKDFFGRHAVNVLEQKFKAVGIDVSFETDGINNSRHELELEEFEGEKRDGKARMMVLRPHFMIVNGIRQPVTIKNLKHYFGGKNIFSSGNLFANQNWFDKEAFADTTMTPRFAFPTIGIIPDSVSKTWDEQEKLRSPSEQRRTAVEAVWDSLLYNANTGKKLFVSTYDVTSSKTLDGERVAVGCYAGGGISLHKGKLESPKSNSGLFTQR